MTFSKDLLEGPYTRERAWDELEPPADMKSWGDWEQQQKDLDARVKRSHYLHGRAGGLSHKKAWLRAYHDIDQHSPLHFFPPAIWVLLLWRRIRCAQTVGDEHGR